jgi:Sortase domain
VSRGAIRGFVTFVVVLTFLAGRWLFGPGGPGSGLLFSGATTGGGSDLSGASGASAGSEGIAAGVQSANTADPVLSAVAPMQVSIPSVGINAPIVRLGLNADRTVEVPASFGLAGWYQGSAVPGEAGKPTVILGHVSSTAGPAVFYALKTVQRGASVWVLRADGAWVRYVIDSVREFPKTHFPTKLVYAPHRGTTIRLVTCGGAFDHSTGHFVDNIVAFGHLA